MACIGVFDSGVGGLSVLRELLKVLPDERYVFFADNACCPYGEKSREFIIDRSEAIVSTLVSEGADIIVIACNTATAAAIATLRDKYGADNGHAAALSGGRMRHIRFIGMEPAVKPAALGTVSGVIGVLATAGTLASSKYIDVRERYDGHVRIVEHAGVGFVELVESGELTGAHAEALIRESLAPILREGADMVVLGCTHYPFLLDSLRKVARELAPDRELCFIDPAPAVARQLVRVMGEEGLPREHMRCGPDVRLLSSGSPEALRRTYAGLFRDSLRGCPPAVALPGDDGAFEPDITDKTT